MNTEERLRAHLDQSTSGLPDVDHLETILAEGARRRTRARVGAVLAVAAAVAVVVVTGQALQTGTPASPVLTDPSVATTMNPVPTTLAPVTTIPPATPGDRVLGVLVADAGGISVIDSSGETVQTLISDVGFEAITVAFEDGLGGIVFQHEATPLPWPQGSLIRLAPGATTPTLLSSPPAGGRVVPVGPAGSNGDARFVFIVETPDGDTLEAEIAVIDLVTGQIGSAGPLGSSMDMTVGGDVISIIDRGGDCPTHGLRTLDGGEIASPLTDCLPLAAGVTVGANGNVLGMLDQGEFTVRTIDGGEELRPASIPDAYMVIGAPGGWVFRTPTATVILDHDGSQTSLGPVDTGWVSPFSTPLEIAPGAILGSGSGELPCTPSEIPLADQDLPAPVAETRAAIYAAAAACDYEALGDMARADDTAFTFGGGTDPVAHWIAEGTTGSDPLGLMVGLLSTTPAGDPETGTWAWPAAHIDPDNEESWTELEAMFDAGTMKLLREAEGYMGLRIGIAADGTWQFVVGGD